MRRAAWIAVGVLLAAGLMAWLRPEAEVVPDAKTLKAEGDAHAARREWVRAAESYRLAFAIEDPVVERREARAWLAYLRGVALARVPQPGDALRWLDRALRLDPDLYVVQFERGLLHDGRHPETTDRRTARAAFEAFLAASASAGNPAADAGIAERAREALESLGD